MKRRTFTLALAAAPLSCLCLTGALAGSSESAVDGHGGGHAAAPAAEQPSHSGTAHWGYSGSEGPEHWGGLSDEYAVCGTGRAQSPIDLAEAEHSGLAELRFDYRPVPLEILNNGHTVQVNVPSGNFMRIGRRSFELLQFHFHTPSEHQVSGKAFPMEVHFVHKDANGELGVVGVFFEEGYDNAFLGSFIDRLPHSGGQKDQDHSRFLDISGFFPHNRRFTRYFGSLTTPPCSQGVNWYVIDQPVQASSDQISAFNRIMGTNARPAQSINGRMVLKGS